MWLEAHTMWPLKFCGRTTVKNVMFGALGWSFIFYSVEFHHFGMVRMLCHLILFILSSMLCLCCIICLMCLVFPSETEQGIFEQVLKGELDFISDPWPSISESAKDLVRRMLIRDPKKRMTAHEVLCEYANLYDSK